MCLKWYEIKTAKKPFFGSQNHRKVKYIFKWPTPASFPFIFSLFNQTLNNFTTN